MPLFFQGYHPYFPWGATSLPRQVHMVWVGLVPIPSSGLLHVIQTMHPTAHVIGPSQTQPTILTFYYNYWKWGLVLLEKQDAYLKLLRPTSATTQAKPWGEKVKQRNAEPWMKGHGILMVPFESFYLNISEAHPCSFHSISITSFLFCSCFCCLQTRVVLLVLYREL